MYCDPSKAIEELARRRKDAGLRKAIDDYLGIGLPVGWPEGKPIATINRYVASARLEDMVFAQAAMSLGFHPYWPTYHAERYMSTNPEKVSYLRPRVLLPKLQVARRWLVADHGSLEGTPLGQIQVSGAGLQLAHDEVRSAVMPPSVASSSFDISEWNHAQAVRFGARPDGRLAPHYYYAVMALYLCNGVLFEDFDGGPNAGSGLARFVGEVLQPALRTVKGHFGLSPLIVRLPYVPGFSDYSEHCAPVFARHYAAS